MSALSSLSLSYPPATSSASSSFSSRSSLASSSSCLRVSSSLMSILPVCCRCPSFGHRGDYDMNRPRSKLELLAGEVEVQPLPRDQLVVRSLLDEAPAVGDEDPVRVPDGLQPGRD